jgi:hypothetical protein
MQAWVPVAFAAVIVIGVVGGQLAMILLKELVPLLRTIAEQKQQQQVVTPGDPAVLQRLTAIEQRLDGMETNIAQLEEEKQFVRRLLEK